MEFGHVITEFSLSQVFSRFPPSVGSFSRTVAGSRAHVVALSGRIMYLLRRGFNSNRPVTLYIFAVNHNRYFLFCWQNELHKFGVRPLPKKKMVLKLKEIYDYTHQGKPGMYACFCLITPAFLCIFPYLPLK